MKRGEQAGSGAAWRRRTPDDLLFEEAVKKISRRLAEVSLDLEKLVVGLVKRKAEMRKAESGKAEVRRG
jgi:hypothetical protein